MVEILIAAVIGGLVGAFGTAVWLKWGASGSSARERRSGGAAAALQRSILDSLSDGVVVYDEDERIVFFNPSAAEILGVPTDSLASGRRTWEPLDADGRPVDPEERPVAITARTGEPCVSVDIGLRTSTGDMRWTTVSTRALREHPGANGRYAVVVAFTDITERREAQRALERTNAELAQFAYVASHDLSEPLRMVSSYLQLLRRRYHGQIDEDADEFIDFAVEGANRMRALIEDLLAYSRAGRGSEPRPIDLGHVMADVLSSLAAAVADARARVVVADLPIVLGDRLALAQVLQNLVANALKFRAGPSACVWVSAERVHDGMWRVSVADDGIGIDAQYRERVFKMFQRLHEREAFEGTGIGLAICRKIVERQGGEIRVDGRPGGGSVFSFTIPAVPAPALVDPATGEHWRIGTPVG
jgi:PAS domain S-box-containing protein